MRIGKATGTIELTSKPDAIIRASHKQFLKALNQRIRQRLPRLTEAIRERVKQAILESYEVQAIINDDDLRGQLGLPDPAERFEAIAEAVAQSVFVVSRPFRSVKGQSVSGRLEIYVAPKDNTYLMKLPEAYVDDFSFLDALLSGGDNIYVAGYQYMSRVLSPKALEKSRTQLGLMIKRDGKGWRVPPEISGNENSNLLSRCLQSREMETFLKREFTRLLTG